MLDSLQQWQALFDNLPQGVFFVDPDGTPIEVNREALEVFGLERQQFLSHTPRQPQWRLLSLEETELPPEEHPCLLAFSTARPVRDMVAGIFNPRKNAIVWANACAVPMFREGEQAPFRVCVTLIDITEQKLSEQHEREAAKQYQLLTNTSMDGYWIVDLAGRIVSVNNAACQMYGYSREEMLTLSIADFDVLETREEMQSHTEKIVANRYDRFESQHRRKDGSVIEVEVSTAFAPESGLFIAFMQDITSKKKAMRELLQSEQRYKAIVETQAEFVVRYRRGGILSFVNDTFCNYIHTPREHLLGKSLYSFIFQQDRETMIRCVESMDRSNPTQALEVRAWLPDGRLAWQKWSNSAILNDEGLVVEYQATGVDITRSKQAEDALRKSEERYRSLFGNMLNGFAYCRMVQNPELPLDFVYLEVNRSFERLTGLKEVTGKRMGEVLPGIAESDPVLLETFRRVALSGRTEQMEYFFSAINEWLSISIYSPEHGCFVAVFDVMTKRKRTQECLAFLAEETANTSPEESFFHSLARYLADALDMEFICIDLLEEGNLYARTLALYSDGTFEDNIRYQLKDTPCGQMVDRSVCCYHNGVAQLFPADAMLQEIKAESYLGTILWGSTGVPIGLIAAIGKKPLANRELAEEILQMVSGRAAAEMERGLHEAERLRLEQQLLHAQKLESLGILAGGIAHDFNNILTGILGNSSLGLMRIDPNSPAVENLQNIEKGAIRAADLAKQMLAYSGKGMFVVEPTNLNLLLDEMIHLLEVSVSKKGQLSLDLKQGIPPVLGDATQLRQVVMNLVINASEAMGDQGGSITISTGFQHFDQYYLKGTWFESEMVEGGYVFIRVRDTGCGMNQETLSRIFDPFFTTKFTGRGLGMSAVLGIVRGHKGAIIVESRPGHGTTFTVLFPPSDLPVQLRETENHEESWRGSGCTILLVDDEETICQIGSSMLGQLGYRVVTANNGEDALKIYGERKDVRFVILDLTMPQMGGEETFQRLRELDPEVKIIMSSGYSEQEVTGKLAGRGMCCFIQKPYSMQALLQVMKKCDS